MALVSNESFLASIQLGTIAAVGLLVVVTLRWMKAVRARGKEINLPTYYVPMGSDAATVIKQAHKEVYAQQMLPWILGKTMKLKVLSTVSRNAICSLPVWYECSNPPNVGNRDGQVTA